MPKEQNPFEIDFYTYILQSEHSKQEKGKLWQTAIGLQQVDGLTPSKYLYETAKRNIDGDITIEEAKKLIDSYYESKEVLLSIHKRLCSGVFYKVKAGSFRDYNISKNEWFFDAHAPKAQTSIISTYANGAKAMYGESVLYAKADMIRQTLDYDFNQEKAFDYSTLSTDEKIKHLARFIANIWQIHPFGDALVPEGTNVNNFHSCKRRGAAYGNTRTTAVFTIKYLNSLGFKVNNEPFEKNSWYFRNSLVRANYTNMTKGIYMNTEYLEKFFRNLLLGESNELKNRYVHIRYSEQIEKSSVIILRLLKNNPEISAAEISKQLGISVRAVEKQFASLREKGKIKREGPPNGGKWIVISESK